MAVIAYCENSVQCMLPDGFCGIQIVQNSFFGRAPPELAGEHTALPRPSNWLGRGYPSPFPNPLMSLASGCGWLQRQRHWGPPPKLLKRGCVPLTSLQILQQHIDNFS